MKVFLAVCADINFPVAIEKTFWGSNRLTFLGMLLDTWEQVIGLPVDKIEKAILLVRSFVSRKKATVLEFQKLCGYLNFLCRAVVPGRVFARRLYSKVSSKLKPHHHISITRKNKLDLLVWEQFLIQPDIFSRPFQDCFELNAEILDMASDASGNYRLGMGAFCGDAWSFTQWDYQFMTRNNPSIEYLELYAVLVGVLNWLHRWKNCRIMLFCDNESVVEMINSTSSRCRNCMVLLRILVLEGLICNMRIFAKHIRTHLNGKADALSRLDFKRFLKLGGASMDKNPTPIPDCLWPMDKLWLD